MLCQTVYFLSAVEALLPTPFNFRLFSPRNARKSRDANSLGTAAVRILNRQRSLYRILSICMSVRKARANGRDHAFRCFASVHRASTHLVYVFRSTRSVNCRGQSTGATFFLVFPCLKLSGMFPSSVKSAAAIGRLDGGFARDCFALMGLGFGRNVF